jgi:hypothetical protein
MAKMADQVEARQPEQVEHLEQEEQEPQIKVMTADWELFPLRIIMELAVEVEPVR